MRTSCVRPRFLFAINVKDKDSLEDPRRRRCQCWIGLFVFVDASNRTQLARRKQQSSFKSTSAILLNFQMSVSTTAETNMFKGIVYQIRSKIKQ